MSKFKKKKGGEIPAVNTASLPDIVFMLLFFFMVATVIKEDNLLIENKLPQANQIEKLSKKKPVSYIYVGKPNLQNKRKYGTEARIQLNDKLASAKDIAAFIAAERAPIPEDQIKYLTVAMKVDSEANMGVVSDIKQELRKVNALKINYTTRKGDATDNQ